MKLMRRFCMCVFVIFFIKAYVVGMHFYATFLCVCFRDFLYKSICCGYAFECIDKSMQFKWVPTTYAFINK